MTASSSVKWVVMVVGLVFLAAVLYARFARTGDTPDMKARQDLGALRQALDQFKADRGRYPTEQESLNVLIDPRQGKGYVVSLHAITDPWGRPFVYRPPDPNQKKPLMLYSRGPNGVDEGGQGDDVIIRDQVAESR